MTMQEVEIFGSELKERIKVTKYSKTDSEQSSKQNHTKQNFQRRRTLFKFFKKIFQTDSFEELPRCAKRECTKSF